MKHKDREEGTISSVGMGGSAVLASINTSMIIEKRDVPSFRGVKLAAVVQVYRACMGWGGKRDTNHAKSVQESLSAAWLDS